MNPSTTEGKKNSTPPQRNDWQHYEVLKAEYIATAITSEEYQAACRRALQEAGV